MYEKYKVRSRWCKMLSRCEDEDHPQYKDYGGRGVVVCSEWHDFNTFYSWCVENNFDAVMQLDRTDNSQGYSPDNCKFVTRQENARNKRSNKILTAFGESKPMVSWSEDPRCPVSYDTLMMRVNRGWDHEDAIAFLPGQTRKGKPAYNARLIEAFGELKTVAEWVKDDRCTYMRKQGIWERINKHGWSPEKSLTEPPGRGRPKST